MDDSVLVNRLNTARELKQTVDTSIPQLGDELLERPAGHELREHAETRFGAPEHSPEGMRPRDVIEVDPARRGELAAAVVRLRS